MNSEVSIIEPETLQYLPAKTMLRLVEKSQQANKLSKLFQQTVRAFPALFRRFEELDIDIQFALDSEHLTLRFHGDGDRLKEVWGTLRRAGYNTNLRPKKGDVEFCAFWTQEGYAQLFMYFTSSLCRRVQIGTEMKEVPIYETQCGELPEIEEDSKEVAIAVEQDVNDTPF